MLRSPSHAVIGATNLEASINFLSLFGFEEIQRSTLPAGAAAALYGLSGETEEALLRAPGCLRGWTRLVATPRPERASAPLDNRAFAIDIFSAASFLTEEETRVLTLWRAGQPIRKYRDHADGRRVEIT